MGGIGTPAVLKMVWTNPSNPLPPPPTNFPNYPGYLNESFTIGFQSNPASAVNWDIAFIPEPGTAALLGFGLVGLWAHARRRSAR